MYLLVAGIGHMSQICSQGRPIFFVLDLQRNQMNTKTYEKKS